MNPRVLLTAPTASAFGPELLERQPGVEIVSMAADGSMTLIGGGPIDPDTANIDVAWVGPGIFNAEPGFMRSFFGFVSKSETLRWFQSPAAGFERPVFGELIAKGVLFTKSDVHSVPIAEFVLRAALDHYQQPDRWAEAQRRHAWEHHEFDEVHGSTWIVIGLGSIGVEVSTRARALGARVVGVRRRPDPDAPVDELITPDALPSVLPGADVIVLSVPANASTRHLVDDEFLSHTKPGALLVNIGRGSIVDEGALLRALDEGRLGEAVLDVFEIEPLPADDPLWDHPKVRVVPHNSALSRARVRRQVELFVDNLGRYRRGEPLRNLVSPADLD
jgi:glyoxylate/hydroxypyruvate reductase A